MSTLDRRKVLRLLGLGVISAGVGVAASPGRARAATLPGDGLDLLGSGGHTADRAGAPAETITHADGRTFDLLSPLTENTIVGDSTLTRIRGVEGGVLRIDLRSKTGHPYRVDILRRDDSSDAPRPVAKTRDYAFFLANGGRGDRATDRSQGLAVYALAEAAQRNESAISLPLKTMRQHWGA